MKTKVTLTIDEELVPRAKALARGRNVSLSQLVEDHLRDLAGAKGPSFSTRWRGKLTATERADDRYRTLAKKYL
ncbi:MAG: DUF6364 family protein [Thermoanaerobaculia bacterium]